MAGPSPAERQSAAAVDAFYAALAKADAGGACDRLTPAARKRAADGGVIGKAGSCEKAFERFFDSARQRGELQLASIVKVTKVKANGDRATARVRFGKGVVGDVPLARHSGRWLLEATSAAPR